MSDWEARNHVRLSGHATKAVWLGIGAIIGALGAAAVGIVNSGANNATMIACTAMALALIFSVASTVHSSKRDSRYDEAKIRSHASLARAAVKDLSTALMALRREIDEANFHGTPEKGPDLSPTRLGAMIQCMDQITSVAADVPDFGETTSAYADPRLVRRVRADFRWASKHLQFPADLSTKADSTIRKWILQRFFHFSAAWQRMGEAIGNLKEAESALAVAVDSMK
jgi:hypothetical protein